MLQVTTEISIEKAIADATKLSHASFMVMEVKAEELLKRWDDHRQADSRAVEKRGDYVTEDKPLHATPDEVQTLLMWHFYYVLYLPGHLDSGYDTESLVKEYLGDDQVTKEGYETAMMAYRRKARDNKGGNVLKRLRKVKADRITKHRAEQEAGQAAVRQARGGLDIPMM